MARPSASSPLTIRSTSCSTSAATTFPPSSIEPPEPKPSRPGPRSPAWLLGYRPSCDRPSCALSRPEPIKLTVPADVRFGLGLIPARLLPELKVSVAQATEPCTNLRIASLIYLRARQMVAATSRSPRDLARETRMAYLAGSHHGTPIEGLMPAGPVVVPKPPPRVVERGEAAAAARSPGESRRLAQASAAGGPAGSEAAAEGPPRPARGAGGPGREPTLFEVKSAPMTIDLSRFREAR